MQQNNRKFQRIQPYSDKDVPEVLARLVKERGFLGFAKMFFPEFSTRVMINWFLRMQTIKDFQLQFVYQLVGRVLKKTAKELIYTGLGNFEQNKPHIFMSNHRDIILDSAILNYIFADNDIETTEIAIGSNLLILQWIEDLAKINKTFIVIRNVPGKKLYHYSYNLSEYIRYAITEKKTSIWIAQREGRTKDGDDRTQVSVLKMMGMSGAKNLIENLGELNIVPLSISYEYEPCDVSKVQELYNKMTDQNYKKSELDDLTSMGKSFETYKGTIQYSFGTPLNEYLPKLKGIVNKNKFYGKVVEYMDWQIHLNYRLNPINYVAADMYFETSEYSRFYSDTDKKHFTDYFNEKIAEIKGDDRDTIKKMFLKIYAMPVKNKLEAQKRNLFEES